jgi:hypothetical protein
MEKMKLSLVILLVSSVLAFPNSSVAQTAVEMNSGAGSICVLPNSPEPPTRISPGGEYNPQTLTVHVDHKKLISWPHKEPVLIEGLDLRKRHLVVLTSDGKRIESFFFKFSKSDDARLCIYFDGYQGVQLGNQTNALWCKVKKRDCWR